MKISFLYKSIINTLTTADMPKGVYKYISQLNAIRRKYNSCLFAHIRKETKLFNIKTELIQLYSVPFRFIINFDLAKSLYIHLVN